jgi:ubiquinone/menaquinone biosynthesis C-methylase UbiE
LNYSRKESKIDRGSLRHKKTVQEYYSERAKDYDRQKTRTWGSKEGFAVEILNEVIGVVAGSENEPMLEVGVGSGRIAIPIIKRFGHLLVGIDLSKEMLKLAQAKTASCGQELCLVLGDAERLPFVDRVFATIVCVSTMHYFTFPKEVLTEISRALKERGFFVYGDLTLHELDNRRFFDKMEKTLSDAHASYCKPSEMKNFLESHGLRVFKMRTVPYRKTYLSLMEDKGKYSRVKAEALHKCTAEASADEKKLYFLNSDALTQFYTLIAALKEAKP